MIEERSLFVYLDVQAHLLNRSYLLMMKKYYLNCVVKAFVLAVNSQHY